MEQQTIAGCKVFVYGTLKQGHGNNYALANSELLGECVIKGKYRMLDLGWYPGVVRVPAQQEIVEIHGEVYRIDESVLHTLDLIEGHPSFYERVKIVTDWKNTWMYFLPEQYLEEADVIADGNWQGAARA